MGLFFGRRRSRLSFLRHIPLLRLLGPGISTVGLLSGLVMLLTGQVDLSSLDLLRGAPEPPAATSSLRPVRLDLTAKPAESLRIATFNIQIFGKKKSSDANVMAVLARVVSQFDVIAIQEVRGGDATPIQRLVDLLKKSGANYAATVSQPIGRTSQTESYAFLWDESRIRHISQSAYLVRDPSDRMHREPMVASFEARIGGADGQRPFRFTLINAHTSPSEVETDGPENELNVLDDVFVRVRQYDYDMTGEEDCILLGDLNVDTEGLRELGQIPGVQSIAGDVMTNTLGSKTYDHIVLDRVTTREYTGRFGVLDFEKDLGLTAEQAMFVSDHLPLWAEFSAYEMPRFEPLAQSAEEIR